MTTIQNDTMKVATTGLQEGWNGDNPSTKQISLLSLQKIVNNVKGFNFGGNLLEIMLHITNRWVYEHQTSTLYNISAGNTGMIAKNYNKVQKLLNGGYIEIVGHGRYGSNAYGPTRFGIEALKALCEVA